MISLNNKNDFKLKILKKEIKEVMGVFHQKLNVVMDFNGEKTHQQINYMGSNPVTNPNISLVALDSFPKMDFQKGNLLRQIKISKHRYPKKKIVSAVNADFFDINSRRGQNAATCGPHIRNGDVVFEGFQYDKAICIGVKKDGTPFIGKPEFEGYHIEIIAENNNVKFKDFKVKINELPKNSSDLSVFISSFLEPNEIKGKKMLIKIFEQAIHRTKKGIDNGRYFIKGKLEKITTKKLKEIPEDIMVLVGDGFFLEDLKKGDIVRLQNRPSGKFSDVYHAVSGIHSLVENGEVVKQTNVAVHPRTAAGLKENGEVFFVVVDGRQASKNMDGITLEQLGEIMKYFDACTAINLDGGGSSTMVLFDEEINKYVICNNPCDGGLRRNANGIGFIYLNKAIK